MDLVGLGYEQRCLTSDFGLNDPRIAQIESGDPQRRMVDERGLQAARSPGRAVAVDTETRGAAAAAWRRGLRNDEIDRDGDPDAGDRRSGQPDARLDVAADDREIEAGFAHRRLEPGSIAEQRRVDREVAVRGVRGDREVALAGPQVDRLRSGDDHCRGMGRERDQRVEQHAPGGNVGGIDHGRIAHVVAGSGVNASSVATRHWRSFSAIHCSSASPSAGIRPLPVRQSTAVCDTAA